jgi:cytochrome oxidase assembly protein ShyY1
VTRGRLRTRWVVGAFVVLAVVVLFVNLGLWQLRRLDSRQAFEDEVARGLAAEPVDEMPDQPYRQVVLDGAYLPNPEVALLGRSLDGQPGNHVLTLMRTDHGDVLIVDRGWVPYDPTGEIPDEAAPPELDDVRIAGVTAPAGDDDRVDGLSATTRAVDPDAFGPVAGLRRDLYVQLTGRQTDTGPAAGRELPVPVPFELEPASPHLSYAIQWFAFAAIAVVGYVLLLRRERRRLRVDTPPGFGDDAAGPPNEPTEE